MAYMRFDGLRFLQYCPNLTSLCLHQMDLRRMSFKHLFALNKLKHLCLESSHVDSYTWLSASKIRPFGLANLTRLNIHIPCGNQKYININNPSYPVWVRKMAAGIIKGVYEALHASPISNIYGLELLANAPFATEDGQVMHIQDYFQCLWPRIDVALGKNLSHACPSACF